MDTTAPAQRRVRLRRFVFTVNGNQLQLDTAFENLKKFRPTWLVVARETCPQTQRRHLQGACVIGQQMQFSTIKKIPGLERAHIESMKGTPQQSLVYCSKEDQNPYQYGQCPIEGKKDTRPDMHTAIAMLQEGLTVNDVIRSGDIPVLATVARYTRGLDRISHALRTHSTTLPRVCPMVIWIHGSTGTGKTRSIHEFARSCGQPLWTSPGSFQWFDGYDLHKLALFDDYRPSFGKFDVLLRLLDRYAMSVPVKGGFVDWQPSILFITAPQPPRVMWNLRTEEALNQLSRRIHACVDADEHSTYPALYGAILQSILDARSSSTDFSHLGELLQPFDRESGEDCACSSEPEAEVISGEKEESKDDSIKSPECCTESPVPSMETASSLSYSHSPHTSSLEDDTGWDNASSIGESSE